MARDARVDLDFADGTYSFRLAWGELIELQEKCDAGPWVVYQRLLEDRWLVQDISQVLRLGLIGGGMAPAAALKLVRTYVEARPPNENKFHAIAALGVALSGVPDDPTGEAVAADQDSPSTISLEESSGSPPSTELEPASDIPPKT